MTTKFRQRQTNITRFLEASLVRQADGKLKNREFIGIHFSRKYPLNSLQKHAMQCNLTHIQKNKLKEKQFQYSKDFVSLGK